MRAMTGSRKRVVVIYDAAAGPKVYRIAVDIAARAWDAGCGVRFRRLGESTQDVGTTSLSEWLEALEDAVDVPEARPEDLEWATHALILSSEDRSGYRLRRVS
jgi:hypothetical protein